MANAVSEAGLAPSTQGTVQRQEYLKHLLQVVKAAVPPDLALTDLRRRAEALANEQAFPSTRTEDWRFTDLTPMLALNFGVPAQDLTLGEADLATLRLPEAAGSELVIVNGVYSTELSRLDQIPQDVVIGSLRNLAANGELKTKISTRLAQASGSHEVFTALNTVGFQDVLVVWVPQNRVIEAPIHVIYATRGGEAPALTQPRCLVVAEANSAVTLIESYWGQDKGAAFTNTVTEVWLETNAQVTHSRIQRESEGTFHIGKTAVTQDRDSHYVGTAVSLGARLSRHNWEIYQTGEQTTTQIYGLGAMGADHHTDTHSLVALSHPHGQVEQLHKAIVDGKAHSVFNGRIAVAQRAQSTSASQLNRNLLLSNQGRIDTKPQLEIVADNVKCAHGATVSQIQADEIFYLQSRGISADQAQRLLIYAFAMEVLEKVSVPSLRTALTKAIAQWT